MKLRYRDLVDLSTRAMGTNKLRSILTMLGVAIGVFSVVGVMTALSAIRQNIDSGLNFLAANVFEISKFPPIRTEGGRATWWRRPNITPRQATEFVARMQQEDIIVTLRGQNSGQEIRFGDRNTGPIHTIVGSNENFILTHNFEIDAGRNLSEADLAFNRPVIVLGAEVVEQLFFDMDPVGQWVVADGQRYEVIGTLKARGKLFGNAMDNFVLVPIPRFVQYNWHPRRSMELSVMAPSVEQMAAVEDLIIGHFRHVRGLLPGQENDFDVYSNESLQEAFAQIANIVGIGGLLISGIALLCAGVGIMNIMLVSVTERTREIGLRKSIGARRSDILLQFLLEAVALSLLGGLMGIALGVLVGNVVAAQLNVPMILPWFWIAAAVTICTAIGVGFGFFPALRAARMRPVEALRYE